MQVGLKMKLKAIIFLEEYTKRCSSLVPRSVLDLRMRPSCSLHKCNGSSDNDVIKLSAFWGKSGQSGPWNNNSRGRGLLLLCIVLVVWSSWLFWWFSVYLGGWISLPELSCTYELLVHAGEVKVTHNTTTDQWFTADSHNHKDPSLNCP